MRANKNITDAEWNIMRIIWANTETTSTQIVNKLSEKTNWSSTTVKTLLARLVQKEIISFNMHGRARGYYPLVSELDCVKNEMNNVIMRLYGGTVNNKTDHFVFYGANDSQYINLLSDELESNYTRILTALEYKLSEEIMVYTHETKQHLHSALGISNGPNWLRAGGAWGILHIAPFECFNDIKSERAAVHIFAQIVINRINPQIPYWLMQGAAAYLAQWLDRNRIEKVVNKNYEDISKTLLKDISTDFETFKDKGGYELAYTIMEFIVENYTYSHITHYIKEPDNYTGIFNCTKEEFQARWLEYLNENYMEDS